MRCTFEFARRRHEDKAPLRFLIVERRVLCEHDHCAGHLELVGGFQGIWTEHKVESDSDGSEDYDGA